MEVYKLVRLLISFQRHVRNRILVCYVNYIVYYQNGCVATMLRKVCNTASILHTPLTYL